MDYVYEYDRHHLSESINCETLEDAIFSVVADIEFGDAWPECIKKHGVALWENPGPLWVDKSIRDFAKKKGVALYINTVYI